MTATGPGTALLVDWPSAAVPDALLDAGYIVVVKAGPGPADFRRRVRGEAGVESVPTERPTAVDLVYCHRPLVELPTVAALARELGAGLLWYQSGLADDGGRDPAGCWLDAGDARAAHEVVAAAGLRFEYRAYVVDALRTGVLPR
jgi:hypothetical protein